MSASSEAVQRGLAALSQGEMIVVIDSPDRENEGDLVVAAELIDETQMSFLVRNTTGIVCTPISADRADELGLGLMVNSSTDHHGTAFTVSVDVIGSGTGVSAADRTRTVRALADPATRSEDLLRPGHIFPLRARAEGVLARPGHTEAAVDLTRMAGLSGTAVIAEIVAEDGSMRRGHDLLRFAEEHDLPVLAISDLIRYRWETERLVQPVASSAMPTAFGEFRAVGYRSSLDGSEHLALIMGDVGEAGRSEAGALVRVHSECLTGDILGSLRCDCGSQLEHALQAIADEGAGVVIYLRGHEGRGIGLAHKIRAYALQDEGLDTVEANLAQGLPVDSRSYGLGAQILQDLRVQRLRLMTNNPAKSSGLQECGLDVVARFPLPSGETPHNARYLRTKRDRMGHQVAAFAR